MFHVKQSANYELTCGRIRLSRDGIWFHDDVEITHPRTVELFDRSIRRLGDGYILEVGDETCAIIVEDAPFIVRKVVRDGDKLSLELSSRETVELDVSTIAVGDDNVMYALVGETKDRARFSRPAYYQLMEFLDQDEDEKFYLKLGESRVYLPL